MACVTVCGCWLQQCVMSWPGADAGCVRVALVQLSVFSCSPVTLLCPSWALPLSFYLLTHSLTLHVSSCMRVAEQLAVLLAPAAPARGRLCVRHYQYSKCHSLTFGHCLLHTSSLSHSPHPLSSLTHSLSSPPFTACSWGSSWRCCWCCRCQQEGGRA